MRKLAICFTDNGERIIEKINTESKKRGIAPVEGFRKITESVGEWTANMFAPGNALIFIGAAGIAVRALYSLAKDKLSDCPVIVIDDGGRFVIPILSGHAGSANKLAVIIADLIGAVPVITTSTDVNDTFSVDTFAVENRLNITDREGIRKVSVKALEGKKVTLSVKDFPPKEPVDVIVADDTDRECSLLLKPKGYTVGLGMRKDKDKESVEKFFTCILRDNGLDVSDVYAICTIDIKEDEEAVIYLRDRYRIPVLSFDANLLSKASGDFSSSEFVRNTVGVDNVCERAALLAAGNGGTLVCGKTAGDGITMAVAKRGSLWGRSL